MDALYHPTDCRDGAKRTQKTPASGCPPSSTALLLSVVGHRTRTVRTNVHSIAIRRVPNERTWTDSIESIVAIVVRRVAKRRRIVDGNATGCVVDGHIPGGNAPGPDEN